MFTCSQLFIIKCWLWANLVKMIIEWREFLVLAAWKEVSFSSLLLERKWVSRPCCLKGSEFIVLAAWKEVRFSSLLLESKWVSRPCCLKGSEFLVLAAWKEVSLSSLLLERKWVSRPCRKSWSLNHSQNWQKKQIDKREGGVFDRWLNIPNRPPFVPDLSGGKVTEPAEALAICEVGNTTDGVHILRKEKERSSDGVITKMIARYLTINQNMLKIVTTWKTDQTQWPPISEKTMLWYVTDGHNMEDRYNTVPSNIRKTMLWYVTDDGHNHKETTGKTN